MSIVFEISTQNYIDNLLLMKKTLSHMETLVGSHDGYFFSESSSKFGWTFFKLTFRSSLQHSIEEKFADMLNKYLWSNQSQKFTKFMSDYFEAKGCNIRLNLLD